MAKHKQQKINQYLKKNDFSQNENNNSKQTKIEDSSKLEFIQTNLLKNEHRLNAYKLQSKLFQEENISLENFIEFTNVRELVQINLRSQNVDYGDSVMKYVDKYATKIYNSCKVNPLKLCKSRILVDLKCKDKPWLTKEDLKLISQFNIPPCKVNMSQENVLDICIQLFRYYNQNINVDNNRIKNILHYINVKVKEFGNVDKFRNSLIKKMKNKIFDSIKLQKKLPSSQIMVRANSQQGGEKRRESKTFRTPESNTESDALKVVKNKPGPKSKTMSSKNLPTKTVESDLFLNHIKPCPKSKKPLMERKVIQNKDYNSVLYLKSKELSFVSGKIPFKSDKLVENISKEICDKNLKNSKEMIETQFFERNEIENNLGRNLETTDFNTNSYCKIDNSKTIETQSHNFPKKAKEDNTNVLNIQESQKILTDIESDQVKINNLYQNHNFLIDETNKNLQLNLKQILKNFLTCNTATKQNLHLKYDKLFKKYPNLSHEMKQNIIMKYETELVKKYNKKTTIFKSEKDLIFKMSLNEFKSKTNIAELICDVRKGSVPEEIILEELDKLIEQFYFTFIRKSIWIDKLKLCNHPNTFHAELISDKVPEIQDVEIVENKNCTNTFAAKDNSKSENIIYTQQKSNKLFTVKDIEISKTIQSLPESQVDKLQYLHKDSQKEPDCYNKNEEMSQSSYRTEIKKKHNTNFSDDFKKECTESIQQVKTINIVEAEESQDIEKRLRELMSANDETKMETREYFLERSLIDRHTKSLNSQRSYDTCELMLILSSSENFNKYSCRSAPQYTLQECNVKNKPNTQPVSDCFSEDAINSKKARLPIETSPKRLRERRDIAKKIMQNALNEQTQNPIINNEIIIPGLPKSQVIMSTPFWKNEKYIKDYTNKKNEINSRINCVNFQYESPSYSENNIPIDLDINDSVMQTETPNEKIEKIYKTVENKMLVDNFTETKKLQSLEKNEMCKIFIKREKPDHDTQYSDYGEDVEILPNLKETTILIEDDESQDVNQLLEELISQKEESPNILQHSKNNQNTTKSDNTSNVFASEISQCKRNWNEVKTYSKLKLNETKKIDNKNLVSDQESSNEKSLIKFRGRPFLLTNNLQDILKKRSFYDKKKSRVPIKKKNNCCKNKKQKILPKKLNLNESLASQQRHTFQPLELVVNRDKGTEVLTGQNFLGVAITQSTTDCITSKNIEDSNALLLNTDITYFNSSQLSSQGINLVLLSSNENQSKKQIAVTYHTNFEEYSNTQNPNQNRTSTKRKLSDELGMPVMKKSKNTIENITSSKSDNSFNILNNTKLAHKIKPHNIAYILKNMGSAEDTISFARCSYLNSRIKLQNRPPDFIKRNITLNAPLICASETFQIFQKYNKLENMPKNLANKLLYLSKRSNGSHYFENLINQNLRLSINLGFSNFNFITCKKFFLQHLLDNNNKLWLDFIKIFNRTELFQIVDERKNKYNRLAEEILYIFFKSLPFYIVVPFFFNNENCKYINYLNDRNYIKDKDDLSNAIKPNTLKFMENYRKYLMRKAY